MGELTESRPPPPAWPATLAFAASIGAVVPFMSQVWYTGPVAATRGTGDLGVVLAGGVAAVGYIGLRALWGAVEWGRGRRRKRDGGSGEEKELKEGLNI